MRQLSGTEKFADYFSARKKFAGVALGRCRLLLALDSQSYAPIQASCHRSVGQKNTKKRKQRTKKARRTKEDCEVSLKSNKRVTTRTRRHSRGIAVTSNDAGWYVWILTPADAA
ncbi:hypothetical protein MTO96_013363 [Rhipicephalus appendiculatus]